jgi:hypothetical protein
MKDFLNFFVIIYATIDNKNKIENLYKSYLLFFDQLKNELAGKKKDVKEINFRWKKYYFSQI